MSADPLDLETLIGDINGMYDRSDPGVQALVEQHGAAVKEHLSRHASPVTAEHLRSYVMRVMLTGMELGVGPEPSRASNVLGLRVAGACLLYRTINQGRAT